MNTKIRAVVVAMLAVASIFAFTSSAQAGTYTVNLPGCGWGQNYGSNGWGGGIYCGPYSASWFQLNSNAQQSVGAPGTYMWLRSARVNDGATMTSLALNYASSQTWSSTTASPTIYVRGCIRHQNGNDIWGGAPNGSCVSYSVDAPAQPNFAWRSWTFNSLTCNDCGGFELDAASGANSGFIAIQNAQATMTDTTAPGISSLYANHAISQGNWLRGTVEVGATGTDGGGGVKAMQFVPNSDITQATGPSISCNYTVMNPCPTSNGWTGSFDTTKVVDGTQTGRYTSTDAADNTQTTSNFTFKVDNTKPDTPTDITPVTNAMNGWSSSNSFGASWTNGAEVDENATQSGLDKVVVDVNPADPANQSDPAPVTVPIGGSASGISATKTDVSGITVPAIGKWSLRLSLVDKAGNVSPVGDGSNGSADSDTDIGYDPSAPAKPGAQANGWIGRVELAQGYDQTWSYTPNPGQASPLCGFAGKIDETPVTDPGTTINIPGDVRKWRLPADLSEATHYVHLRAITCAGIASPTTETVDAKVDLTDPTPTFDGVAEGKWYKNGQVVNLHGADELSGMAPSGDTDPEHGAYIKYHLGADSDTLVAGDTASPSITGEGQKTLSFSPVDVAGNTAKPTVVTFGIDASNPVGHFEAQDSNRPTLIKAPVGDVVSGVDYATISVRKVGGGDWTVLPTSLTDDSGNTIGGDPKVATASARFPDTHLSQGTYEVRLNAFDQAGNQLSTGKDANGHDFLLQNPMRAGVSLTGSLFKAARKCGKKHCVIKKCTKKSKSLCYIKRKGKVVLLGGKQTLDVAYKRGAIVAGALASPTGAALAHQPLEIYATDRQSGTKQPVERLIGSASTDANGTYSFRIPAGLSRTIRVYYPGTEQRQDAAILLNLGTGAKITAKVSKKHAFTGQTVTFSGRVSSYDGTIPAGGKLIVLQFKAGKRWLPAVAVAHTNASGKFSVKYKFAGKRIKNRITFRVFAPSEDNWGHAASASHVFVVKLN